MVEWVRQSAVVKTRNTHIGESKGLGFEQVHSFTDFLIHLLIHHPFIQTFSDQLLGTRHCSSCRKEHRWGLYILEFMLQGGETENK